MPTQRKLDPLNRCRKCEKVLARRRMPSGRLEDMGAFKKRKFCDQSCMAAAMEGVIKILNPKNSRRQSGKAVRPRCERCGKTTKRHVHHADENPLNNDPSNLKTLCASCHGLSHSPNWDKTTGQPKACSHCSRPARRKGLCWTHLTRFKRYGHPLGKTANNDST